jgi:hypothetical protein
MSFLTELKEIVRPIVEGQIGQPEAEKVIDALTTPEALDQFERLFWNIPQRKKTA